MSKPEQIVIPVSVEQEGAKECMTFKSELSRDNYITQERVYGWEVRLNYLGTNSYGTELYEVRRQRR